MEQRLMIVCGVPGAGKSTLALRAIDHWGAVGFASETFADQLGSAARTTSGDLSKEAVIHAYSAMRSAVTVSLATTKLVLAVGSFRSPAQRSLFRDLGAEAGACVTVIRVSCPIEIAASRVRSRKAHGERGPNEEAIRAIDVELNQANDIDFVLYNDASIDHFFQVVDALLLSFDEKSI